MLRLMPALFLASFAAAAAAPNWSQVPAKTITLFTPGQTSIEWLMAGHKGAGALRSGTACRSCHTGQERVVGAASLKKHEPAPIPAKPGTVNATVQFARDAQTLYVRLQFSDAGQPDAKMDKAVARVALLLDGGGVPEAARAGCWAGCHDDSAGMPNAKGSLRTMHLGKARAATGLEYWEAAIGPGGAATAANGVISDKRRETRTAVTAQSSRNGTTWSVILSRKLDAGIVALAPGRRYNVAFAIDVGHTAKRFHYVSFGRSLVLDQGSADFIAK